LKAAVCDRYGPPEVVQIREVPTPAPADGEVLIKAAATTVNSGDARVRALRVPRGLGLAVRLRFGLTRPKQPIFGGSPR
jgi:NADPH:quinone reductase-like Zn-dependent oxidoreductase